MTQALQICDLKKVAGEPRIHDLRLGEALEMPRPRNIRRIIRHNARELQTHGKLHRQVHGSIIGKGRVQENDEFYLNEAQTMLICMFSRTPKAEQVRKQIIDVFMAYRRGELQRAMPAPKGKRLAMLDENDAAFAAMEKRVDQIEKMARIGAVLGSGNMIASFAHLPVRFRKDGGQQRMRRIAQPRFWSDLPVRTRVLELHRQGTIDWARTIIAQEFGEARAPSPSAMARVWLQVDQLVAVH